MAQIGFRISAELEKEFQEEANRRNISVHQYAKEVAIRGHLDATTPTARSDVMLASVTTTLTTIRRLAVLYSDHPGAVNQASVVQALQDAKQDSDKILATFGLDHVRG